MAIKSKLKRIIPESIWNFGHYSVALLGAIVYQFPSRKIMVIGVTGTNGKSTVVQILHQIFMDFGIRVASFSSIRSKIIDKEQDNKLKMTMPGRSTLQKFLNLAQSKGCQIAILEVTSEGLKQYRDIGIGFDAAAFTNLKPEHIDAHGSFEAYREAKGRLFKKIVQRKRGSRHITVFNLDDPSAFYYANFPAKEKYGFGLLKENERYGAISVIPEDIRFSPSGISFKYKEMEWISPLVGDFNLYNILTAIALASAFRVPLDSIRESIKNTKDVPGRMELIQEKPFRVIVDHAHTPDALESVFRIARSFWANPTQKDRRKRKPKIIAVFGSAGGGRDKWKRAELGRVADKFTDKIVITNEDPHQEDPMVILRDIEGGVESNKYHIIPDRREAIAKALSLAEAGDVVLVLGKGSEKAMVFADKTVAWSEQDVTKEELKKLSKTIQ